MEMKSPMQGDAAARAREKSMDVMGFHCCSASMSMDFSPIACCCISLCWHLPVPAAKQNGQTAAPEIGLGPAAAVLLPLDSPWGSCDR